MEYPTTFPEGCDDPLFHSNLTGLVWYAYTWMYSNAESKIFTIGLPIALIIGTLGNGAFLYVLATIPRLHTITNYYLANMAFADVGFIVTSIGTYLYAFHDSPVRHDAPYDTSIGCSMSFGVTNAMYYTSLGLVCLVTLERYYGICFPLQHRAIASKGRTKKLIGITWIVACILSAIRTLKYSRLVRYCTIWPQLPDFIGWPQKNEFCVTISEKAVLLSDLTETIPFFVALIWNGYMFSRIIYTLGHRDMVTKKTGDGADVQNHLQGQAAKIHTQVARMLVINGTLFFICQVWIRINDLHNISIELFGNHIFKTEETYGIMLVFGRCMLYVNSSLNPFVYNLTSSFYRDAFKEAFCGRYLKATAKQSVASIGTDSSRL